jgi:hypothetical protein
MNNLCISSALGKYDESDGSKRFEFQIGTRLVWVRCGANSSEAKSLEEAEAMLASAFAVLDDVLLFAETHSRSAMPEVWRVHDGSVRKGRRLDVWGITVIPAQNTVEFDVHRSHGFDFATTTFAADDYAEEHPIALPDFPQRYRIGVTRLPSGELRIVSQSSGS